MARADPQLTSFAGGEISPLARGRIDVQRYATALHTCDNYILTAQGPAVHRPGTQYIGATASSAKALLIPFVASTGNEFILEVTGTTTRFWYGPGRNLVYDNAGTWNITSTGSIATLSTPWAAGDLFDTDGTPRMKWVQSNDVMWLVHPSYFPYKITRTAAYKFTGAFMGDGVNAATPFKDVNPSETVTLQASAATGAGVTITASAATFTAADVGGWLYLERPKADSTKPWESAKALTINNVYSSNGRYYNCGATTTSGTVRPTHSYGTRSDGAIDFEYYDDGYGVAAITAFTDTTHVTVTVTRRLPNTTVSGSTTRWAKQAWNSTDGFPAAIAFFRERLCFGRGQTIWTSVVGDFENFTATDAQQATADMAITATIASSRNDRIRWIAATQKALIVGTASGEFAVAEQSDSEAFGPSNVRASPMSGYGCNGVQPVPVAESLVFVERGGRRVRETLYDANIDGFRSTDLTVFADHIFARGTCAGMAHQRVPFGVLWATTVGGQLKGLTYQREQEVFAWHPHTLGGVGLGTNNTPAVRSLASIVSPDRVNDDLWLCVERRINGSTVYYIEIIGPHLSYTALGYVSVDDLGDVRDSLFVDCAVQKTLLAAATSITGLTHLTGETVTPVIDGALGVAGAVAAGTLTLAATSQPDESCKAWVGFTRNADLRPVPLVGASEKGSAAGKKSRIVGASVLLYQSLNYRMGKPGGTLDRKEFRRTSDDMSAPTPLRSGLFWLLMPSGSTEDDERPELMIRQDQPFPSIVQGIYPTLSVE